jgi:hypothetical protein
MIILAYLIFFQETEVVCGKKVLVGPTVHYTSSQAVFLV